MSAISSSAPAPLADEAVSPDTPRPSSCGAPSRVLICRPNGRLGNTLLLTPLVQELEEMFPGAEIDVLTAFPAAEEIFRPFSCVRVIHQLPYRGAAHMVRHTLTLIRAFRTHYDLIVDPCPRSWSSRFAARVLRGRMKIGFSSAQKRDGFDRCIPIQTAPEHMGAYPVHLIRKAFGTSGRVPNASPPKLSLRLSASEREFGIWKRDQLTHPRRSNLTLAVTTRATGKKQLPEHWWRELLGRIVLLVPALNVIEILPASGRAGLPEYPGYFSTHLRRVAAVINATDCFVSADSGLMHLGSATDAATVGLFSVTDPNVYAPYGGSNCALSVGTLTTEQIAERVVALLLQQAGQTEQPRSLLCADPRDAAASLV